MDQISRIIADLEYEAGRAVARIALNAHANLVAAPQEGGTPIRTGWASANWIPSVGSPVTGRSKAAGASRSSAEVGSARAAGAVGQAAVAGYKLGQGKVFIENNVPYIKYLNRGSSTQAPSGFVNAAIKRAVSQSVSRV